MPSIPLILGFEDLFCSSILFFQKERKEKSGSSGKMGRAGFAAALISIGIWKWKEQYTEIDKLIKSVL